MTWGPGVGGLAPIISTISSGIWKAVTLIKSDLYAPVWLAAGISAASVDEHRSAANDQHLKWLHG